MRLPAREVRVTTPRTHLDEFVPTYHFSEFHSIPVSAPKERVYRAIRSVTASEILLFRTLTWIRRFGRPGTEGIVNPPPHEPLLDVAIRTSFLLLAEEPNREFLVGTIVFGPPGWRKRIRPTPAIFKAIHEPGYALAAMNFILEEARPGVCTVSTETRVYTTDTSARRRFAAYWCAIYPGSALIRRMWLRAIARRAESSSG